MEKIVIEIDEPTAKEFRKFSPETRNRFNMAVSVALKKMINDATTDDHMRFLDAIGEEARKNGLTEEILNDLLKSDD